MSTTVGRFEPPSEVVSVTDGKRQLEFDRPADMLAWFRDHPEDAAAIDRYVWTTRPIGGARPSGRWP